MAGKTMLLAKLLLLLALIFGLMVVSKGHAEIYKWIDEKGNVQYGDCPPPSCDSKEVQISPPPSGQSIKETKDRFERLQEYKNELRAGRKEETKRAEKSAPNIFSEVDCFASIADAWGGKIHDTREEVQRRPLADAEIRRLIKFFQALEGSWRGHMEEINCVQPDANPPYEIYHYGFRLDAQWKADKLFEIEADLEGEERDADLRRQFLWLLLSRDGLRFMRATVDVLPELDKPRYDVEIYTTGNNSLTFFLHQGGVVRRTSVISLRKAGRGFTIKEFFYVQGMLAGKRLWAIEK
jgi:hypothetical protein